MRQGFPKTRVALEKLIAAIYYVLDFFCFLSSLGRFRRLRRRLQLHHLLQGLLRQPLPGLFGDPGHLPGHHAGVPGRPRLRRRGLPRPVGPPQRGRPQGRDTRRRPRRGGDHEHVHGAGEKGGILETHAISRKKNRYKQRKETLLFLLPNKETM